MVWGVGDEMETIKYIAVIVGLTLLVIAYLAGHKDGHRAGQINALNGKIYYQLERQENNSFIWVECPTVCEYEKGE